ncbi:MAG: ribosome biogenesis GTPase Der [Candidatus Uhrbacteria bacterium]
MPQAHIPIVALIGRTNVGKSTLFNRLLERQASIVSKVAGTTRDRKEGVCLWRGLVIKLIDTGGLDMDHEDEIEKNVVRQAEKAIAKADVILFVVDMKQGALPQERELAAMLMKSGKPVIVVGNKAETPAIRNSAMDPSWRLLALPSPIPVSGLRGTGTGDLLDVIYDKLETIKMKPAELQEITAVRVAVVGKPNVGKSSLINAILGEERFIVSPVAHTTREPNDVMIEYKDREYLLIDTAGLLKAAKMKKQGELEEQGAFRTERVLPKANVALFVVDVTEPVGTQDKMIAGMVKSAGTGVIIVANKWDLVKDKNPTTINRVREMIAGGLPFIAWAPTVFVSAKTTQRIPELFTLIDEVEKARHAQIPERDLETFWRSAVRAHLPSRGKGPKPPEIMGMQQTGTAPPTFNLHIKAKRLDVLHPSYLRFLENRMRIHFKLTGTPIVINIVGMTARAK